MTSGGGSWYNNRNDDPIELDTVTFGSFMTEDTGDVVMQITTIPSKRRAVSLILKCVVVVAAAVGVYASYIGGLGAFMSGPQVFMLFTIQSNIAIALICAIGAVLLLGKKPVRIK